MRVLSYLCSREWWGICIANPTHFSQENALEHNIQKIRSKYHYQNQKKNHYKRYLICTQWAFDRWLLWHCSVALEEIADTESGWQILAHLNCKIHIISHHLQAVRLHITFDTLKVEILRYLEAILYKLLSQEIPF